MQSKKIPNKEFVDYMFARKFPYWEKYKIEAPKVTKVPPNSVWVLFWWRPKPEMSPMEQMHMEVFKKAKPLFRSVIIFYNSELPIPPEFSGCYVVRVKNDTSRGGELLLR